MFRYLKLTILLGTVFIISACQSSLESDIQQYEENMEDIYELDRQFLEALDELDLKQLETVYATEADVSKDDIAEIKKVVDESLVPLSTKMNEKIETVEVSNEELKEVHEDYVESLELKETFAKELGRGIDLYLSYKESTNQLIKDGEAVSAAKKERQSIIQGNHSKVAAAEIDQVIDIVNERSGELEENVALLQSDNDVAEKQRIVDEVLMPILDTQIDKLNQLSLETDEAKSVRSISLEMFYTFKSYYKERINIIQVYEEEQNLQIQNIVPKTESFNKLDMTYSEKLNQLKESTK
ncbi:EMYY motif lipoprotein [Nosocomiicoccus ampullae]|uniref:EMYY motif lipoprotein n=1 Tax=Nosocomiicoccus ampullae TaxID=489910 RepID=UPI00254FF928|nr:EMYY motif lipoprotein [Nosocomiicoccus ampullae]MDK6863659.1 EMYY motif lipoprotein [Nosocomiicoccus ampullae]